MTQNARTIVRTTRGRLGIVAAGVITVATILTPTSAIAAPAAGSASRATTDSSPADIAVTGTMPGTDTQCTSDYQWQANGYEGFGGYSQVEWTSNPCSFSIQERSWCSVLNGVSGWETSGVVVSTDLWDKTSCDPINSSITRGEVRFNYNDGSGWSTYTTFWTA
jgi:hypothetical protein